MTDVDKLEAGPEFDVLIAEKVMRLEPCDKWEIFRHGGLSGPEWINNVCQDHACYPKDNPSAYSTNIAAAWGVVERLADDGYCPGLIFDDNGHWALSLEGMQNCSIGLEPQDIAISYFIESDMWCDTAPLAICRAALKAAKDQICEDMDTLTESLDLASDEALQNFEMGDWWVHDSLVGCSTESITSNIELR